MNQQTYFNVLITLKFVTDEQRLKIHTFYCVRMLQKPKLQLIKIYNEFIRFLKINCLILAK